MSPTVSRPGGVREIFSVQFSPQKGLGTTILVVDDDALIALNTVDVLTDMGHVALEAFSGAEALTVLDAHPEIAALITDFSMPGMNGVDLAQEARKRRPNLPVLLVSGYSELPDGAATDLPRLEKPFREDDLSVCLSALLGVDAV